MELQLCAMCSTFHKPAWYRSSNLFCHHSLSLIIRFIQTLKCVTIIQSHSSSSELNLEFVIYFAFLCLLGIYVGDGQPQEEILVEIASPEDRKHVPEPKVLHTSKQGRTPGGSNLRIRDWNRPVGAGHRFLEITPTLGSAFTGQSHLQPHTILHCMLKWLYDISIRCDGMAVPADLILRKWQLKRWRVSETVNSVRQPLKI